MKLIPVLTEKSLALAKEGKYCFWVPLGFTKPRIKKVVGEIFEVHPVSVKVLRTKKRVSKNMRGMKVTVPARKKAIVALGGKEKIDLFEVRKSGK